MKLSFLLLISLLLFSCKKDSVPLASQQVSGTLYFSDPAVDGAGLYYQTDGGELLIFKNEFANVYDQYANYKALVNVHTRLTYTLTGGTSCLSGMVPGPCSKPLAVVRVVKLEKQ